MRSDQMLHNLFRALEEAGIKTRIEEETDLTDAVVMVDDTHYYVQVAASTSGRYHLQQDIYENGDLLYIKEIANFGPRQISKCVQKIKELI